MARPSGDLFGFTRSLGFRLAMLLTIAILPIGLISIIQTLHLSREAERSAELALLGRTSAAAAGERALLQSAIGTADALGPAVLTTLDDPAACSEVMGNFIQRSASFVFAGFTPVDGINRCNSGATPPRDLTSSPHYQAFMRSPSTLVTATRRGPMSGQSVVIVSQPLYRDRELLGYIAVSLSHDLLRSTHSMTPGTDGAHIVTFNAAGQTLSSDSDEDTAAILPQDTTLAQLVARRETTFAERSNTGENRVFAVVSVVPGLVYALGSWSPRQTGIAGLGLSRFAAVVFPLALWAVSLAVAYFAVYRLVLRHVRELRGQMRRFAIGDRSTPPPVLQNAPAEIADVSETFHNMARILIRDEAAMEEAVQEKTVLLKEVHHRVKNNLQLIASIINMQSRVIDHADAKRVLRSVQDRVQSLATIYRNLYQAEHLDSVEAERLVADIIQQMSSATVATGTEMRIETSLEPLTLLPDQAVPLSLLTNEAFTNAVKYAGRADPDTPAWVRVTLARDKDEWASLRVENSLGPESREMEGTGLGSQLIEAFAMQLEGEAEVAAENGVYRVEMRFRPATPQREAHRAEEARPVVLTSKARAGARH
ncbi:histidine kinase dimerization/phosphoacceptor domain -containing protein [Paracoccus luteus]|uniref:histidine kinase dimerization/phosphoacceptor domain -containing protein n=1 Tax=Paracoccus luteus TaxID=2508543 RepID=UPI00106FBFDB|nr:histidine kinase dimerization/phosphoacceptor domain -containing protein [Paracoccus luteus]